MGLNGRRNLPEILERIIAPAASGSGLRIEERRECVHGVEKIS